MTQAREVLFGIHPVLELLKAGQRSLDKLLVQQGRGGGLFSEILRLAQARGVPVHFELKSALDRLVSHEKHQGVVALVAAKSYHDPEDIIEVARKNNEPPFVLILDGVEDPRNLGAILRTAEGAGVHGIILPRHRTAGLTGTVMKTSAGALEHLTVARVVNLSRAVDELKEEGFWIVGLDPRASRSYTELEYRGPIAVVVGGESRGIRKGLLAHCDYHVSIPMKGRVRSLNVSVATGILLYEILRQREAEQKQGPRDMSLRSDPPRSNL